MKNKLYRIGEFASMNKISTRMLRHYDKIALLKPMSVEQNGYRYYSEVQIAAISQIKMLRDCHFTLDEIAQALKINSENFVAEQAKLKIIELNKQATLNQKALRMLNELSSQGFQNNLDNQYGIFIVEFAENILLTSNYEFDFEHIENELNKLFIFIDKKRLITNGCAVLLSRFNKNEESNNKVGVPVTKQFCDEKYSTIGVSKSKCITTIHYGDYYNIGHAYSSIMKYAELNGYLIEDCFVERYFIDSSKTADCKQFVTEISVPIINNP